MPLPFFICTSMFSASLGIFGSFQCKGNLSKHPVYGCGAHHMKQLSPCFPHRHPHSHHSLCSAHLGTNHTIIFSLTSLSPPPGGQQTSFPNEDHQDLGNARNAWRHGFCIQKSQNPRSTTQQLQRFH